jgi:hypothetical protein
MPTWYALLEVLIRREQEGSLLTGAYLSFWWLVADISSSSSDIIIASSSWDPAAMTSAKFLSAVLLAEMKRLRLLCEVSDISKAGTSVVTLSKMVEGLRKM